VTIQLVDLVDVAGGEKGVSQGNLLGCGVMGLL
jgi:hypothetical protein